jgi:hypothetical protein
MLHQQHQLAQPHLNLHQAIPHLVQVHQLKQLQILQLQQIPQIQLKHLHHHLMILHHQLNQMPLQAAIHNPQTIQVTQLHLLMERRLIQAP